MKNIVIAATTALGRKNVERRKIYLAKAYGGEFRVKDASGRFTKYDPRNFFIPQEVKDDLGIVAETVSAETFCRINTRKNIRDVIETLGIIGYPTVATTLTNALHAVGAFDDVDFVPSEPPEEKKSAQVIKPRPTTLRECLLEQGVPESLIEDMAEYRKEFSLPEDTPEEVKLRIPKPTEIFTGGDTWIQCITAILAGKHLLLSGEKATGKNTLANSLAFAFQKPLWDISFHNTLGKDDLIGCETFRNGEVVFNPGMVYNCALHGGFGVLDEINMAKDNAISVLNSVLDDRRVIDVPGYNRLNLAPSTTFVGTMNYGYSGTRPLNEALASRFVIPTLTPLGENELEVLVGRRFPTIKQEVIKNFVKVFLGLQAKAKNAEISTASVDLRGILNAIALIERGLNPNKAMTINIANKAFEDYERVIIQDVINLSIPSNWDSSHIFGDTKSIVVDMSGA